MKLSGYLTKRDFKSTTEPRGKKRKVKGRHIFVVQQHDATRMHFDFRLEMEGVLKSWAVPKGPSLNPADKRLAMQVEDHPYDYKDFEGTIPEGNYGAGNVIVWDKGYYHGLKNGDEMELLKELHDGDLKIVLKGQKLNGAFALVRIKGDKGNAWLLIKKDDEYASKKDILKQNKSVVSGKPIIPRKRGNARAKATRKSTGVAQTAKQKIAPVSLAAKKKLEPFKPMLAKLTDKPFDDPQWLFETKYDGYRAVTVLQHGTVSIYSRNLNLLNKKYPELIHELQSIPHDAIIDGEVVAENKKGKSDFQLLQNRQESYEAHTLRYYVFDLVKLGDHDLAGLTLLKRKKLLEKLLQSVPGLKNIRYSKHTVGKGKAFYKEAVKKSLEGIIAKEIDGIYHRGRRSSTWLKIKIQLEQEMIILGFTEPSGSRKHFGSILLGYYKDGELHYAGNCGTGFNELTLASLYKKASAYFTKRSPFKTEVIRKKVQWIRPKLVCQVRFTEWTRAGSLRHPVYLGLRTDKKASQVTREMVVKNPKQKS